jgi:hypothetical protein
MVPGRPVHVNAGSACLSCMEPSLVFWYATEQGVRPVEWSHTRRSRCDVQ